MITCCTVLIYLFFVSGANILSSSLCSTLFNGNIVFPAGIFNLHQHLSQRNNSSVFHRLHSRTNYFYFSYVPSVITVWNTLPVDIRSSSSVSVLSITYCTGLMSCIGLQLFTCCLPYLCTVLLISEKKMLAIP